MFYLLDCVVTPAEGQSLRSLRPRDPMTSCAPTIMTLKRMRTTTGNSCLTLTDCSLAPINPNHKHSPATASPGDSHLPYYFHICVKQVRFFFSIIHILGICVFLFFSLMFFIFLSNLSFSFCDVGWTQWRNQVHWRKNMNQFPK